MNQVNTTTNTNPKKLQKAAIILLKAKKHNKFLLIQMASSLAIAKRKQITIKEHIIETIQT